VGAALELNVEIVLGARLWVWFGYGSWGMSVCVTYRSQPGEVQQQIQEQVSVYQGIVCVCVCVCVRVRVCVCSNEYILAPIAKVLLKFSCCNSSPKIQCCNIVMKTHNRSTFVLSGMKGFFPVGRLLATLIARQHNGTFRE